VTLFIKAKNILRYLSGGDDTGDSWHRGDDNDGFMRLQEKIWGVSLVFRDKTAKAAARPPYEIGMMLRYFLRSSKIIVVFEPHAFDKVLFQSFETLSS